jgi:hypothetical protein
MAQRRGRRLAAAVVGLALLVVKVVTRLLNRIESPASRRSSYECTAAFAVIAGYR